MRVLLGLFRPRPARRVRVRPDPETGAPDSETSAASASGAPVEIKGDQALRWGEGSHGVVLADGAAPDAASRADQATAILQHAGGPGGCLGPGLTRSSTSASSRSQPTAQGLGSQPQLVVASQTSRALAPDLVGSDQADVVLDALLERLGQRRATGAGIHHLDPASRCRDRDTV